MKKHVLLILFLFANLAMQAQKGLFFSLSSGISTPTGDFAKFTVPDKTVNLFGERYNSLGFTQQTRLGMFWQVDTKYQFDAVGFGATYGHFNHQINKISYNMPIPTILKGGIIKGNYYGVGPQYIFGTGKIKYEVILRAGIMNFNMPDNFSVAYNGSDLEGDAPVIRTVVLEKTSLTYASSSIKIDYKINKKLSLFSKIDYIISFGKGLPFKEDYYTPIDIDQNDTINHIDVSHFVMPENHQTNKRYIKPSMVHIGIGFAYHFGSSSPKIDKHLDKNNQNITKHNALNPEGGIKRVDNGIKKDLDNQENSNKPVYSKVIIIKMDETPLRQSGIKLPKDKKSDIRHNIRHQTRTLRAREHRARKRKSRTKTDERYNARHQARTLKDRKRRTRERRSRTKTDARHNVRHQERSLRDRKRRTRERRSRTKTDARNNARHQERTLRDRKHRTRKRGSRAKTDARYNTRHQARGKRQKRIQSANYQNIEKPVTTNPNYHLEPGKNLTRRIISANTGDNIQIAKGKYQLSAPKIEKVSSKDIIYMWQIKKDKKIKIFEGKSIEIKFYETGRYDLQITPKLNGNTMEPFKMTISVD